MVMYRRSLVTHYQHHNHRISQMTHSCNGKVQAAHIGWIIFEQMGLCWTRLKGNGGYEEYCVIVDGKTYQVNTHQNTIKYIIWSNWLLFLIKNFFSKFSIFCVTTIGIYCSLQPFTPIFLETLYGVKIIVDLYILSSKYIPILGYHLTVDPVLSVNTTLEPQYSKS